MIKNFVRDTIKRENIVLALCIAYARLPAAVREKSPRSSPELSFRGGT